MCSILAPSSETPMHELLFFFSVIRSVQIRRVGMSSKTMTGEEELTKKRDDLRDHSSSSLRQKSSESLRQGSTGLLSQRSFGSQRSRVSTSASTGSVHGFLHFPLG